MYLGHINSSTEIKEPKWGWSKSDHGRLLLRQEETEAKHSGETVHQRRRVPVLREAKTRLITEARWRTRAGSGKSTNPKRRKNWRQEENHAKSTNSGGGGCQPLARGKRHSTKAAAAKNHSTRTTGLGGALREKLEPAKRKHKRGQSLAQLHRNKTGRRRENSSGSWGNEQRKKNRNTRKSIARTAAARLREKTGAPTLAPLRPNRAGPQCTSETPKREPARVKVLQERKSGRDQNYEQEEKSQIWYQHKNKMQTRNILLRSRQSLHPIHGGLRPPSLFLIETKFGSLLI
jgi:hypothetical protein